jgi:hypothetical protein
MSDIENTESIPTTTAAIVDEVNEVEESKVEPAAVVSDNDNF